MKLWKSLSSSAAVLCAGVGVAQADVTASDVWEAWKSSAEAVGQTLTPGSESQDGGTLTISDLQVSMETTDVEVSATIPNVTFTENGDGTVTIETSDSYTMTVMVVPPDDDVTVEVPIMVAVNGLSMIASGDPGAVNYDFEAAGVDLTISEISAEGETMALDGVIALSGLAGTYQTDNESDQLDSTVSADELAVTIGMDEPGGGGGRFDLQFTYADLQTSSSGAMMMMSGGVTELSEMLASGVATEASITHGAATYMIAFQDGSDQFNLDGSSDSGLLEIALSSEALSYDIGNTGLDLKMSGSEIPLPEIAVQLEELGLGLLMPVSASEEPQDFAFALTLGGMSVSDMIWSMIDPAGQLPHDPATIVLDIDGKANFLFDVFNPESMMMVDAPMPAEIHALNLNELKLAAIGAELTGDGAFTFDMTNLETFDGMPAPTGKIMLRLVGANAVIDNLVAMGLLPEDQAMGARMMMGLFARPGDGPDTLVSEIEVDGASGAISANGQRLQ